MNQVIEEEKRFLNTYFTKYKHGHLLNVLHSFMILFRDRFIEESEVNTKFLLRIMFLPTNHLQDKVISQYVNFYRTLEVHVFNLFEENKQHLSVDTRIAKKAFMNTYDGLLVELIYVNVDSFEKRLEASWSIFYKAIQYARR